MLYWLSGLTCNDENFTTKAGAQRVAADGDRTGDARHQPARKTGCQR
ncbi:hypothetical protein ACLK2A_11835 [Escherichia coli]